MTIRHLTCLCSAVLACCGHVRAQATIEGRVDLPKSKSAPVMNKRYEIISKNGVLATNPPLAVVYLEGSFPKNRTPPVAKVDQATGDNEGNVVRSRL